jgi:peptidyl-prolyl cis-trans isomerase D
MKRWLFILPFVAIACMWATDPKPGSVIGKIDEVVYTYADYQKILTNYFSYYEKKQGSPLTEEDKAELNNRCWEELVGRYIYDKAIKSGKITITTQELLREAKRNPPTAVKQIPDLVTKGRFDQKKYEQALTEAKEFREAVLDEVRELYQYDKLLKTIRGEAVVVEDSVRQQWMHENDLVDAKVIFFDANRLTTVNATEDEARLYYNEHLEEYKKENCRRYRYVRFPKAPSPEDSLAVHDLAMQMYRDLIAGADFAQLARDNSQDPGSAQNGGDLGWFGRGKMVPVFEETAFKTPAGDIAEPVLSNFGWHIIQTVDRRQTDAGEEVSARHILLRIEPSEKTQQEMKSQSSRLHSLAGGRGLQKAADEMGMKVEETPPFQESDAFIRGIGRDPKLITFAFTNPEGSLTDIYYAPSGDFFVCEVSAVLPVYYTPFEDEKSRIINNATRSKRGYYMNEYVQNFIRNLKPEQYIEYADRDSIMVVELTGHKMGDSIASIGKVPALDDSLFSTPEGSYSGLISEQLRWFLAKVEKHQQPDPAIFERDKQMLMDKARETAGQDHLNEWYFNERKKVSIIDNRRDYYDLSSTGKVLQL